MSDDLFDDPELFAVKPAPEIVLDSPALPPRRSRPKPPAVQETPAPVHKSPPVLHKPAEDDGPVASFACFCGFRDEVRKPAPDSLNCPECKAVDGLKRWVPRYPPPLHSARELTDKEVARLT